MGQGKMHIEYTDSLFPEVLYDTWNFRAMPCSLSNLCLLHELRVQNIKVLEHSKRLALP